jgi:hypothetical protein
MCGDKTDEKRAVVENLWMTGANPVDNLTTQLFLSAETTGTSRRTHVDAAFVISFA